MVCDAGDQRERHQVDRQQAPHLKITTTTHPPTPNKQNPPKKNPVLKFAHGFHALLDDEQLQRPHDYVGDHLEPRVVEVMRALVECHQTVAADQRRDHRARRPLPSARRTRKQATTGRTGAASWRPARRRRRAPAPVRHAGLLAGVADQVHQSEDHQRAEPDRQPEVGKAAARQEQAGGEVVAQRLCTSGSRR